MHIPGDFSSHCYKSAVKVNRLYFGKSKLGIFNIYPIF